MNKSQIKSNIDLFFSEEKSQNRKELFLEKLKSTNECWLFLGNDNWTAGAPLFEDVPCHRVTDVKHAWRRCSEDRAAWRGADEHLGPWEPWANPGLFGWATVQVSFEEKKLLVIPEKVRFEEQPKLSILLYFKMIIIF